MRRNSIPPLGIMSMLLNSSSPGRCANCICHRRNEPLDDAANDAPRSASYLFLSEQGGMLVIRIVSIKNNDEHGDGTIDRRRRDFMSMFGSGLDPMARHLEDMHGSGLDDLGVLSSMGSMNDDDGARQVHGSIDRGRHDITTMSALDSTATGPTQQAPDHHRGRHLDLASLFALDPAGQQQHQHGDLDRGRLNDGHRRSFSAWAMSDHPPAIDTDDGVEHADPAFISAITNAADAGRLVTA